MMESDKLMIDLQHSNEQLKQQNDELKQENKQLKQQNHIFLNQLQSKRRFIILLENIKVVQFECMETMNRIINSMEFRDMNDGLEMMEFKLENDERLLRRLLDDYHEVKSQEINEQKTNESIDTELTHGLNSDQRSNDQLTYDQPEIKDQTSHDFVKDADEDSGFEANEQSNDSMHIFHHNGSFQMDNLMDNGNDNHNQMVSGKKKSKERKKDISIYNIKQSKYQCLSCGFTSNYKQNVERHQRLHTGERPFKCQFNGCMFAAAQAGNLKVHQQRHKHFCD